MVPVYVEDPLCCRAMFDGHYKEKEASIIPVPNISFQVFEKMMRAIYTSKF